MFYHYGQTDPDAVPGPDDLRDDRKPYRDVIVVNGWTIAANSAGETSAPDQDRPF
jgi:hypothetical protein